MKWVHNCLKVRMSPWDSTKPTCKPSSANKRAAVQPASPAPATMTSNCFGFGCASVSLSRDALCVRSL
jgi:hypothetical protein